jgi:RNA polymerase sigma factor (TIGR02999 family)
LSTSAPSAEITSLLKAWSDGDQAALERLAERVYPELRLLARRYMKNERQANTLQTTALVHEVYLRLVDVTKIEWHQRAQFFAMAAQMMRRILVDAARARGAGKRGGRALKVNFDETALLSSTPNRSILALDEALTAFSRVAPRQAKIVELRYFGGLTEEEIVAALKVSPRTVRRDWDLAKAWLLRELGHRMVHTAHDSRAFPAD